MRAFVIASLAACGLVFSQAARAHDHDRPELDEWYKSLINSNGGDCCDRKDCKPLPFGQMGDPKVDAWLNDEKHVYQFRARPEVYPHANGQIVDAPLANRAYQWVAPEHDIKRVAANPYGMNVMVVCAAFDPSSMSDSIHLYCIVPPDFEG